MTGAAMDDNRIARWLRLHLEALAEVGVARLRLSWSSWRRVLEESQRRVPTGGPASESLNGGQPPVVDAVERAIWRIDRFVPGSTCIHRAVAGHRMLTRRGIDARVVIGLRSGDALEGHAWIEIDGGDRLQRAFIEDDAGYQSVWGR